MGYNKVIFQGNLTKDIELKTTQSGSSVGKSSIAVNRKYKAADGSQKEEVMFMDITFFGRTAEIANQYLKQGSNVLLDGRIQLSQWKAEDGTNRSKHELIVENMQMLNSGEGSAPAQPAQSAPAQPAQSAPAQPAQSAPAQPAQSAPAAQTEPVEDEEIPF